MPCRPRGVIAAGGSSGVTPARTTRTGTPPRRSRPPRRRTAHPAPVAPAPSPSRWAKKRLILRPPPLTLFFPTIHPLFLFLSAAVETSINQVGFSTPPSTGAAPSWDAIVEVGGSQQFVSEGRYYECHSLKGVEPGAKIAFERVLATLDGDEPTFGMPYVKGARVEATVLENFKDKKLIVFKYRRKKHYKRKNGHRQPMTRFLVTKVVKP
jgi:large subunit ribosomal protein L21